jgi:predicted acetyltransferase
VIAVRECVDAADLEAAWRIRALAFGESRTPQEGWTAGGWRGWVAELDGRVCGFARAWPYRQFFGGRAVPMAGLASVAVDPYARGRGVASAMLDALLPALREGGQPLSALYASVFGLYLARGWETVGVYEWVEVPLLALRSVPPPAGEVALRPAVAEDLPALHDCYLRLACSVDGLLDRRGPPFEPWRLLELDVVTVAGDRAADGGHRGSLAAIRGYVAAARAESGLVVYDLVAHDPDTLRALLRSLASWSGQLSTVRLRLLEPRAMLPAALGTEVSSEQWMLRVVDLPAAVAARGWPRAALLLPGLGVDIEVIDQHAPWHAGPYRLVVSHAEGRVVAERGGSGAVQITARGLAAWYAGSASSAALRRAGLLDGDRAAAAALDALTASAGPPRLGNAF